MFKFNAHQLKWIALIGMMGNTGPHLHFQVDRFTRTAINPMQFVSGAPYVIN